MKILSLKNSSILDLAGEPAILKIPTAAGATVSMTLDDNTGLINADYILVGEIGKGKTEIAAINASVTRGVLIQVAALVFPHNAGTPIRKIPYNQVKFYRAVTLAGNKSPLSTVAIDVEKESTSYEDNTNTDGFGFFTFYNSTTAVESGFSVGFDYAEPKIGTRLKIRTLVEAFYKKPYDETTFQMLCDLAETEIFAMKRWRFREASGTFNTVAAQQAYTPAETGISNLGQMIYATYDGDPLIPINIKNHKLMNWNTTVSGTPRVIWEWNGSIYISPTPSEVKAVIVDHYKNSSGFTDETTESEVQIPQAIAFKVLSDLWSVADRNKSQFFATRYMQVIAAMKINDQKQVTKFSSLTDNRVADLGYYDQVNYPTIV